MNQNLPRIDVATFCEHRARFMESGIMFTLLADLLANAVAREVIVRGKLRMVSTCVARGAASIEDVCTGLRKWVV